VGKREIQVTFETITPIWTGDINGECTELKPASIIGSLRFWFEVICFFSGICNKKDFINGRFEKEVDRKKFKKCLENKDITFESKVECLLKQNIPLPSIIFGTTNWKSLIEIKSIKYLEGYCFGNRLNLPTKICINRSNYKIKENYDCPKKSNEDWSVFYFANPYFYGKFEIKFQVEEKIVESIFYPILTFMDRYGFWGGKWNIGYGRLRVLEVKVNNKIINNWKKSDFELFDNSCFSWKTLIKREKLDFNSKTFEYLKKILNENSFYCETEIDFNDKIKNPLKKIIFLTDLQNSNNSHHFDYKSIIKSLLRKKMEIRNCLRHKCEKQFENCFEKQNGKKIFVLNKVLKCNNTKIKCSDLNLWKIFRHKLLGEEAEGSKILPFIYKENGQLKGGLLSIAGLLNLEGGNNE